MDRPPSATTTDDASNQRFELLLDVPLEVTVQLGRTRMTIHELLALGPGSVVELDKVAGEPLDIIINDRLVARGEAVVVNDKFGVRITDIVSRSERIARLR
jgi:flagellar motor switch protein FliN/FliY